MNSIILNCEVWSKIQSNMSVYDLNNIEVEVFHRSYDSLIIDKEYVVEKVCLQEDENGPQLLMFFEDEQYFIKLPRRYSNYYYAKENEMEKLQRMAVQQELAFRFDGYYDNGIARFKFGPPGTLSRK